MSDWQVDDEVGPIWNQSIDKLGRNFKTLKIIVNGQPKPEISK